MCLILLLEENILFVSTSITLLLSWFIFPSSALISCSLINEVAQKVWGIDSTTDISSDLVYICVLRISLFYCKDIDPCPKVIIPPLWLFISEFTINFASLNQFIVLNLSYLRSYGIFSVPYRWHSRCIIFYQFNIYTFSSFVPKNTISSFISEKVHWITNVSFVILRWNVVFFLFYRSGLDLLWTNDLILGGAHILWFTQKN